MREQPADTERAGAGGLSLGAGGARVMDLGRRVMGGSLGPFVGLGVALIGLVLYLSVTQEAFLDADNATNLLRTMAVPMVLTAGMTLVLLTAGVDLSMGGILAFCGILYAQLVTEGVDGAIALPLILVAGAAIGFLGNGVLIGRFALSFFVVTLATGSILRGFTQLRSETSIDQYNEPVSKALGDTAILGDRIPVAALVAAAVILIVWLMLRLTAYGRSIYAVGGNQEAAELSGIRGGWVIAGVYGISGLVAALAAVMTIGRTTSASPTAALNIELQVAAAALLGGVALSGGVGSIWGAVMGVVFLAVLSNGLDLAGVASYWQLVITGVVLLAAIWLDLVRNRRGGS